MPAIHQFIESELPYRLAFSVTLAIAAKRGQVMPIEKTYPLQELEGPSAAMPRSAASGR